MELNRCEMACQELFYMPCFDKEMEIYQLSH